MRERTDITTTTAPYISTRPGNIPQYFFHEASTPLNSGVPQGLESGPGAGKLIQPRSHRDWHSSKKKKEWNQLNGTHHILGPERQLDYRLWPAEIIGQSQSHPITAWLWSRPRRFSLPANAGQVFLCPFLVLLIQLTSLFIGYNLFQRYDRGMVEKKDVSGYDYDIYY